MALRWKKHARKTGLQAIAAGPRGSDLRDGEDSLATVYASRTARYQVNGWYWVSKVSGEHVNTCSRLAPDEATAKAQAFAHVKKHYTAPAVQAGTAQGSDA